MTTLLTYQECVDQTMQLCKKIANDPQAKVATREAFYKQYGGRGPLNYGDSELAFLKWEIKRGVLNPLAADLTVEDEKAGSPWWRNVNLHFIYLSELAGLMYQNKVDADLAPMPTQKWLAYIEDKSGETWYRAHNASILSGFQLYEDDAKNENEVEQIFLNIILYRLMFAQAMVEDATIFGEIGSILANPKGFSVDLIVHMSQFYPTKYPLDESDKDVIEGHRFNFKDFINKEFNWQEFLISLKTGFGIIDFIKQLLGSHQFKEAEVYILDDRFILPHLSKLYQAAAVWNDSPFLLNYVQDNQPIYPT